MSYLSLEKKSIFNLWKVIKFLSFFIQFIKKSDISIIVVPKLFLVFTIWNEFWILQKKKELLTFNPYFFTFLLFTLFFSKFQKFPFYCSHDFFSLNFWNKNNQFGRASWHLAKSVIFKNPISVCEWWSLGVKSPRSWKSFVTFLQYFLWY